ncbi:hypothetical protein SLA2020_335770 [Shorea laevis]
MSSLCVILVVLIICLSTPFAFGDDTVPSAYEVLQDNNFPVGLLPRGVTGYEINKKTGEFSAYLNGSCSFSLENSYQIKYESTIKGVISKDRLKNLKGVSVKVFLLWLDIVEVVRDGDELQFSVGVASADFPVENFVECPHCGSGLNCNKSDDFLSSF